MLRRPPTRIELKTEDKEEVRIASRRIARFTRASDPDDDVDVSRRSRIAKRDERNRFDRVDVIASVCSNVLIVTVVPMITAQRVFSQPSPAASR